jgi:hypothetical protein
LIASLLAGAAWIFQLRTAGNFVPSANLSKPNALTFLSLPAEASASSSKASPNEKPQCLPRFVNGSSAGAAKDWTPR